MTDKFETTEYLEQVQNNYEQLLAADPGRFVRIDAAADLETVTQRVVETMTQLVEAETN